MATPERTALITGIAGQDGSYLAELLLERGYRVVGTVRAETSTARLEALLDRLDLRTADLVDRAEVTRLVEAARPDEIYNLAGHSFVPTSWERADMPRDVTTVGAGYLLDAIREVNPAIRFYQASSSEIFGNALEEPQSERTPPNPRNPYGAAKAAAHAETSRAREGGLFAVSGILYNHESPRRGREFVSRKVSDGVARIALGAADSISMGSLDAERDWGFAGDYVRAMWLMLQHDTPGDYVIATGVPHTVRDMCRIAFAHAGLDYERHVVVDPSLVRPPDAVRLIGDSRKARRELGWQPEVAFETLLGMMVDADIERLRASGGA
jgi:GDPmannose 4,6-dehydratase